MKLYNFDMKPVVDVFLPEPMLKSLLDHGRVTITIHNDLDQIETSESSSGQPVEMRVLEIIARDVQVQGAVSASGMLLYRKMLFVEDESAARAFAASQNKPLD